MGTIIKILVGFGVGWWAANTVRNGKSPLDEAQRLIKDAAEKVKVSVGMQTDAKQE